MDSLVVKQVTLQNAATLRDLSEETFVDTYGDANTKENMRQYLDENFALSRVNEELKDPHSLTFFALLGNEPVGYIKLNLQKEILDTLENNGMEIARIYVKKKFQGRKIGKLLFDTATAIAKENKQHYIWLGVWEKNPNAILFYEKMGFHNAGHHLFKLGNDLQRDIIMRFDL